MLQAINHSGADGDGVQKIRNQIVEQGENAKKKERVRQAAVGTEKVSSAGANARAGSTS